MDHNSYNMSGVSTVVYQNILSLGLFTNIISRVRQDGWELVWSIKDDLSNLALLKIGIRRAKSFSVSQPSIIGLSMVI